MEFWIWAILVVVFVGAAMVSSWLVSRNKKECVRTALEKRGARQISIDWKPWVNDRSNYVFSVSYLDASGKPQAATCKVEAWGDRIYWEERP
jgi:hypothetical protein